MNRRDAPFMAVCAVLAALLPPVSNAFADVCEFYPPIGKNPTFSYSKTYENHSWGYAVDLPAGFKCESYADKNAPNHGCVITLSWEPRVTIDFNGEANSLEDRLTDNPLSAFGHALFQLEVVNAHSKEVLEFHVTRSALGSMKAYDTVAQYECENGGEVRVQETILAVTPGLAVVFSITLETTQGRYESDRTVLFSILRNWREIQLN